MKVDFLTNLSGASLFVADHMSTTWIEALANDIPIMLYINIGSYEMTREMKIIIDMLQKVSVIHYDIKSLTDAINKNFNNTEEWWNEKERVETIRIARNELIYSSQTIIDNWPIVYYRLTRINELISRYSDCFYSFFFIPPFFSIIKIFIDCIC